MSDPKINQKYGVPRNTFAAGFAFRRSTFLDSIVWSYFAPGQSFQCQDKEEFEPPTDWPKAGSLLRVPQVVWLTPFMPNVSSRAPSDVTSAFEPNPPYMDRTRTSQGGFAPDQYPATAFTNHVETDSGFDRTFWNDTTWNTIPNEDYLMQVRLEAVFAEAKARIEAIRPNRTWVQINTLHLDDYSGDDPDKVVARYSHIATPNLFVSFFGTNFLHIYCGFPAHGITGIDGSFWDDGNQSSYPMPADDPLYPSAASRVRDTYAQFSGYATHLYGYEHSWETAPDSSETFSDGSSSTDVGTGAAATALLNQMFANGNAYLEATAVDLADYGFVYKGSGEPDADTIVREIADHFGFDPDTGVDIG